MTFKPYQTISQMFPKSKEHMDKEETHDPIYNIPCTDCSKSYVGEMQRKFITRKDKHQKAVARRQGKRSALTDQVIKTNHDIPWDEATILRTNIITGTKERFSRPGRLTMPKNHSTEMTGRYSPRSIYT